MEENLKTENEPIMYLNKEGIRYLSASRKWTLFISGLFALLLVVNIFNIVQTLIKSLSNPRITFINSSLIMTLAFCSIYCIIIFYLSRYSFFIKKAINTNNNQALVKANKNLKNYFAFLGIFLSILLVFYLFIFIGNLIKPGFIETLHNVK